MKTALEKKSVSQRVDEQYSWILYGGKVHLDFDPVKHSYKINGTRANGVTTALQIIAKPQLVYWSANQAGDYVKENIVPGVPMDEIQIMDLVEGAKKNHLRKKGSAADKGTYIHNWIEAFVNGEDPSLPASDQLKKVIEDFLKWWDKTNVEVITSERMLCSPTLMLAGTPDLVCRVDGKLTIMDWKTGSGIYPEMYLQLAAYAMMLEEEYPEQKVEQLYIVNASVNNMFQTECRSEVDLFKETYLKAYELYKAHKEVEDLFKK